MAILYITVFVCTNVITACIVSIWHDYRCGNEKILQELKCLKTASKRILCKFISVAVPTGATVAFGLAFVYLLLLA